MNASDSEAVFVTAAESTPPKEVEELAEYNFGISGSIERLSSERDQNFLITTPDRHQYILKIANPAEDQSVTDLQTQILRHIADVHPALPVQRLVPTKGGSSETRVRLSDGSIRTTRLVTCLQGIPLHKAPASKALRKDLGRSLGELDLSLKCFSHPSAKRSLLWNVSEAMNVRDRLVYVTDREVLELARAALERFEKLAFPILNHFPSQVIHCDFNPHNVLVDANNLCRVSGILDFGDALFAPRVNDIAIAASYHLTDSTHLRAAGELVAGYHSVNPINREEIDLLPVLIGARLAMTVAITSWRAEIYPENRDYILRNSASARVGLRALSDVPLTKARTILHTACGEGHDHDG